VPLGKAYRLLNGERPFVLPGLSGRELARQLGQEQIDRALGALEARRPAEVTREVLGFVLMVTTPRRH
jgi:hypothetical protein